MVHRREIEGIEIVLGNQGDLYLNAMTWWDHGTGSVWSQPRAEAILGPLAGTRLEPMPSTLTTWGSWRRTHPETLALAAPGGRSGFDLDLMLVAVELNREVVAVPVPLLRESGVVAAEISGVEVTFVMSGDLWAAYVLGEARPSTAISVVGDALVGTEGARWDLSTGRSLSNGNAIALPRVPAFTIFEADLRSFWPTARIVERLP